VGAAGRCETRQPAETPRAVCKAPAQGNSRKAKHGPTPRGVKGIADWAAKIGDRRIRPKLVMVRHIIGLDGLGKAAT